MRIPTEHQEQCAVIQYFDLKHKGHRGRLFAIPNGSYKSRAAASSFKREGLRAGVPDLMLPVARGGYHGLFIEMKRLKGSVTSKEQKDWHEYLNAQGYLCVVCKGFEKAKEIIDCYLTDAMSMTKNEKLEQAQKNTRALWGAAKLKGN